MNRYLTRPIPLGLALLTPLVLSAAERNWDSYLGDPGRSHYSELKQIKRSNVKRLQVAWTFHTGDARPDNLSQIQCNPLVIDGVLFGSTPQLKLFALNAASGQELWRFDPFSGENKPGSLGVNRGLVYWTDGTERRILFSADHFLYAVDVSTGQLSKGFGNQGKVDIKEGLGRDVSKYFVGSTTPGALYRDLLLLPLRLGEGPAPAAPGHIRAFDVRTGKIVWTFHTIPYPNEPGYETWPPDAWTYIGGVNCWSGMAVDEKRGIVFAPTGSPAFDFWGGNRLGQNLYANCLVALDAATGRRLWHYQFVHHDLWDRDLPAPPNLLTVTHSGRRIDAVAQITKSGHVFVFDRVTGEPLFPISEHPVPPSELQGEVASPTQPWPDKPPPFARQLFSYDQITDISPSSHRAVLDRFLKVKPHVPFGPPSTQGTIIFPGFDGGGEWGGAAVDPQGIMYVNGNEMPWILTMMLTEADPHSRASSARLFAQICAACHGLDRNGNATHNVPSLVEVGKKLKREEIIGLLGRGRGVMPSFGFLSEQQKGALADLLLGKAAEEVDASRKDSGGEDPLGGIPYTMTGYNRWLDTNGYPAVKPPWGTLNAIDLNTGTFRWRVPLGEDRRLSARGIPPTGLENYGGPVVTAGGLLFIGASKDEMFRALDRRSGAVLWQVQLPAGAYATPATYLAQGRQFVVVACGGGKMGTKSGDAYVAFALPK